MCVWLSLYLCMCVWLSLYLCMCVWMLKCTLKFTFAIFKIVLFREGVWLKQAVSPFFGVLINNDDELCSDWLVYSNQGQPLQIKHIGFVLPTGSTNASLSVHSVLNSRFLESTFFVGIRARHDFRLLRNRSQIDLPALFDTHNLRDPQISRPTLSEWVVIVMLLLQLLIGHGR